MANHFICHTCKFFILQLDVQIIADHAFCMCTESSLYHRLPLVGKQRSNSFDVMEHAGELEVADQTKAGKGVFSHRLGLGMGSGNSDPLFLPIPTFP